MIGFFKFDEQPSVAKSLVLAHAVLNEGIKGYFYVREMDCKDTSSVSKDSEFFGVLDDASGFGACLFVKDLQNESDAMLLQQNLHVKGNSEVDGNEAIKGNLKVDGNEAIKGNLKVDGNEAIKGNLKVDGNEAIKGNLKVDGQITGKSTVTKLIITADDMKLLAAQITTMPGPMAAATLNQVTVEMQNG